MEIFFWISFAYWLLVWFCYGTGITFVWFVGTPLQYSCLENPMNGGVWWAAVHGVPKSLTWLSNFTFTFHFPALEKEMASHSSVLAWRIPGTGEPGGLPSMGLHRVGHNWRYLAAAEAANLFLWCSMLLSLLIFYIPLTRMYIPLFGCKRLYTNKVQLVDSIVQVILHSLVYYLLYQLLKNDC